MSVKVFGDIHYAYCGNETANIIKGVFMEQMLTAKEVAKALCLTDQTVYRLIAAGKLRSYRVGLKKIAIDAESVKKYLGSIIISYKNDLSDE